MKLLDSIVENRPHRAATDKTTAFRHLTLREQNEVRVYLETRIRVMNPEEPDHNERLCSYIGAEDDQTVADHFSPKFSCTKAQVMKVRIELFGVLFKKGVARTPKGEAVLLDLIGDLQDEIRDLKNVQTQLVLWASIGSAHPFKVKA